jgi:hypothetical protein
MPIKDNESLKIYVLTAYHAEIKIFLPKTYSKALAFDPSELKQTLAKT